VVVVVVVAEEKDTRDKDKGTKDGGKDSYVDT
jgi:hypothetical protein